MLPSYITAEFSYLHSCDSGSKGLTSITEATLWVQNITGVTRMYKCLRGSTLLVLHPFEAGDESSVVLIL